MANIETIIFDLDGTLIDSSTSILAGFAAAFAEEQLVPTHPLSPEIIGPPLKETLAMLAGSSDPDLIDRLAERFKAHYDTEGFKETTVFEGVPEMLQTLWQSGRPMHIATNKRLLPTLKILDHLGWRQYFKEVKALDAWSPPAKSKGEMIGRLLVEAAIPIESALYVGDREEDYLAATANQLAFAHAAWGYGAMPAITGARQLTTPKQLGDF